MVYLLPEVVSQRAGEDVNDQLTYTKLILIYTLPFKTPHCPAF